VMRAIKRPWVPLATIVVAVGVHVAIIAALPKGRPHVVRSASVAAAELAPRAPVAQFQAFAPSIVAPALPAATAAQAPKPRPAAARPAAVRSRSSTADNATIDMRPHDDDDAPIRINTPLPVTVVMPPPDAR